MKKMIFFISLLFLVSLGCQKEEITSVENELTNNTPTLNLTDDIGTSSIRSRQMVPLKGEIIEVGSGEELTCFGLPYNTHYDDISGHLTHLGNAAGGYADLLNCRIEVRGEVPVPFIVVDVSGQFMAANNDILSYEGEIWISTIDFSAGNSFAITGGTGRWEDAAGHFTATFEPREDGTILYGVSGEVTPPGSNK